MEFITHFSGLTEAQVRMLFMHSQAIAEALKENVAIVFPAPLVQEDMQIRYQFIDLPAPLVEQMQNKSARVEDMRRIGQALRLMHRRRTPEGNTLLHGDFTPHNAYVTQDRLFIIDPHPPQNLPFREDILYGDARRDVIAFLFGIFSDAGLKRALKDWPYYRNLASGFLSGYGPGRPFLLPALRYGRDAYVIKRAHFSHLRSLARSVGCSVAALWVIWRSHGAKHAERL
ncbi:MAG: hypothetical protein KGJ06_00680 [Pseudomonadota bacterium]|nr:hypothetical protein [Pseudomonadota bacterium]